MSSKIFLRCFFFSFLICHKYIADGAKIVTNYAHGCSAIKRDRSLQQAENQSSNIAGDDVWLEETRKSILKLVANAVSNDESGSLKNYIEYYDNLEEIEPLVIKILPKKKIICSDELCNDLSEPVASVDPSRASPLQPNNKLINDNDSGITLEVKSKVSVDSSEQYHSINQVKSSVTSVRNLKKPHPSQVDEISNTESPNDVATHHNAILVQLKDSLNEAKSQDDAVKLGEQDDTIMTQVDDNSNKHKSRDHDAKPKEQDDTIMTHGDDNWNKNKSRDHDAKSKEQDDTIMTQTELGLNEVKSQDDEAIPREQDDTIITQVDDNSNKDESWKQNSDFLEQETVILSQSGDARAQENEEKKKNSVIVIVMPKSKSDQSGDKTKKIQADSPEKTKNINAQPKRSKEIFNDEVHLNEDDRGDSVFDNSFLDANFPAQFVDMVTTSRTSQDEESKPDGFSSAQVVAGASLAGAAIAGLIYLVRHVSIRSAGTSEIMRPGSTNDANVVSFDDQTNLKRDIYEEIDLDNLA